MHHHSAFSLTKVLYLCVNYNICYGKLTGAEVGLKYYWVFEYL